jgi:hypothetical protein
MNRKKHRPECLYIRLVCPCAFCVRESKIDCGMAALYSYPIQEERDLNSLLYVGCSRACHHLIVLMPENADRRVQKAFTAARSGKKTQS